MRVIIEKTYEDICYWVALYIKSKIHDHKSDFPFVLGLPTGSTPIGVYNYLIKFYKNGSMSFKNVITFNMDEYVGLKKNHSQSYRKFMYDNLFNHIDIPDKNINLLDGNAINLEKECEIYETKIHNLGGIDLFLCGIGQDGHIAFNEPGSSFQSLTRIKTLSQQTIIDNSRFFEHIDDVPKQALTVGIQTIMNSREIIIMASGIKKSIAIKECIEGSVSNQYTCTIVQNHRKAIVICDDLATNELRVKTYNYYKNLQKNIDLLGKPIKNNIIKYISKTDKIIITSPHPDDDVIGMGGLMDIISNKGRVKIIYMTNGLGGLKEKDNLGNLTRIKEAVTALKILGYKEKQVYNANLPFYNNINRNITNDDMHKMSSYLNSFKANHIFICIDKDPNGTHIKCAKILQKCIFPSTIKFIWLYKSAWETWSNYLTSNCEIYISKKNFKNKLLSIDMHLSQENPLVVKKDNIVSFKDIVIEKNKSEKYPGHFQEKFRIMHVDEFKKLNIID